MSTSTVDKTAPQIAINDIGTEEDLLAAIEAFRWIQKTAMDRRMGMREVAEAVVAGMDKA